MRILENERTIEDFFFINSSTILLDIIDLICQEYERGTMLV